MGTPTITILPKTTSIIIFLKATIIIFSFILERITVPSPEASTLQPNATPATMTPSSIPIINDPKKTPIIIPTATTTTTVVLILKTTMITLWMVTLLVPLLPLPPIATLIMPLLEEIIRIMCVYRDLSAIRMELYYVFLIEKEKNYAASGKKRRNLAANDDERSRIDDVALIASTALVEFLNESIQIPIEESISDVEMKKVARSAKQRLPQRTSALSITRPVSKKSSQLSAVSVTKKSLVTTLETDSMIFRKRRAEKPVTKKISLPSFISHPNGILLKVLNQKPRPRKQSSSSASAMEMETESEIAISTSSSSSSMVKIETETKTNRNAEQRVKQLKRVKQRVEHYSHTHHRPQQQYKSKRWTIAIILKLTFVAWDSWTYRIGY